MPEHRKYQLNIEERQSYVFASVVDKEGVRGKDDPCYLDRIAEHCARCHCSSILIEKRTSEKFAVWDAFVITPKLAKSEHPYICVAVVEKGAGLPSQRKLNIAIGNDQGISVRVFTDESQAEHWLTTGELSRDENTH